VETVGRSPLLHSAQMSALRTKRTFEVALRMSGSPLEFKY
jgi:hypothetical protein